MRIIRCLNCEWAFYLHDGQELSENDIFVIATHEEENKGHRVNA